MGTLFSSTDPMMLVEHKNWLLYFLPKEYQHLPPHSSAYAQNFGMIVFET